MSLRLIIAGGRDYKLTSEDKAALDALMGRVVEVVCGCCTGADEGGKQWAIDHNIPVQYFPANWTKYGDAAGPIRNEQMAVYANAVALFPGGKGTASMARIAKGYGLRIFDFRKPLIPSPFSQFEE